MRAKPYLLLTLGAMTAPKRAQRTQKSAITRLQPRQPNLSTRPEAIGAKRKVPTPDPQTQMPEKERMFEDVRFCSGKSSSIDPNPYNTCGQVKPPTKILAHSNHGRNVHQTKSDT